MTETHRKRNREIVECENHALHRKDPKVSQFRYATRPSFQIQTNDQAIVIQVLTIEDYIEPRRKEPKIRIHGVDAEGHAVTVVVHGFLPYFYVSPPLSMASPQMLTDFLNKKLEQIRKPRWQQMERYVLGTRVDTKHTIQQYNPQPQIFWRITCTSPKIQPLLLRVIQDELGIACFEANVQYIYRFMIDHDMRGGGWIELPAFQYTYNTQTSQFHMFDDDIVVRNAINEIAPIYTLSFDIECAKIKPGGFPSPRQDPVIQIANYVTIYGQEEPIVRNIFVLHDCDPIEHATIYTFADERELLSEWRRFLQCINPGLVKFDILSFFR